MKLKDILLRITGISCPIFGVSWNPPEAQTKVVTRLIRFLEDRRVLYVPSEMEVPHHCVQSVLDIRRFITNELLSIDNGSELATTLQALRAACRKFLNTISEKQDIILYGAHRNHWASWEFNGAVGELRGVFGVHLARLAAQYGTEIEDELASILPGKLDEDEGELQIPF